MTALLSYLLTTTVAAVFGFFLIPFDILHAQENPKSLIIKQLFEVIMASIKSLAAITIALALDIFSISIWCEKNYAVTLM